MKKRMTFIEILETEDGRCLIESIEEAEDEIRDREIDWSDTSEFWVRARNMDIETLEKKFGFIWK